MINGEFVGWEKTNSAAATEKPREEGRKKTLVLLRGEKDEQKN